jgi:hypothetical protein
MLDRNVIADGIRRCNVLSTVLALVSRVLPGFESTAAQTSPAEFIVLRAGRMIDGTGRRPFGRR